MPIEIEQPAVELSKIAVSETHGEDSPYFAGWKAYDENPYDELRNPSGVIQMGLAENQVRIRATKSVHDCFCTQNSFLKNRFETGLPCSAISCNRFHLTCWRSTWSRIQNQQAGGINLLAASEIMLCFKTIMACNLLERCIYMHTRFSVLCSQNSRPLFLICAS